MFKKAVLGIFATLCLVLFTQPVTQAQAKTKISDQVNTKSQHVQSMKRFGKRNRGFRPRRAFRRHRGFRRNRVFRPRAGFRRNRAFRRHRVFRRNRAPRFYRYGYRRPFRGYGGFYPGIGLVLGGAGYYGGYYPGYGYGGYYPGSGYAPVYYVPRPVYRRYRGRLSCAQARRVVRRNGFYKVRATDCRGSRYTFKAKKRGRWYRIRMRSNSGRLYKIRRI